VKSGHKQEVPLELSFYIVRAWLVLETIKLVNRTTTWYCAQNDIAKDTALEILVRMTGIGDCSKMKTLLKWIQNASGQISTRDEDEANKKRTGKRKAYD